MRHAIESAAGAHEVIVVDNGGKCADLCRDVRYFGRPDEGVDGVWRNNAIAIENATGDYIVHIDADDWLVRLPEPEGDWYFADLFLCDERNSITGMWNYSGHPRNLADARVFAGAFASNPTPTKAAFRMDWLRAHGLTWYTFPRAWWATDARTSLEYHKHSPRIVYAPDPFIAHMRHAGQASDYANRDVLQADIDEYLKGEL